MRFSIILIILTLICSASFAGFKGKYKGNFKSPLEEFIFRITDLGKVKKFYEMDGSRDCTFTLSIDSDPYKIHFLTHCDHKPYSGFPKTWSFTCKELGLKICELESEEMRYEDVGEITGTLELLPDREFKIVIQMDGFTISDFPKIFSPDKPKKKR